MMAWLWSGGGTCDVLKLESRRIEPSTRGKIKRWHTWEATAVTGRDEPVRLF